MCSTQPISRWRDVQHLTWTRTTITRIETQVVFVERRILADLMVMAHIVGNPIAFSFEAFGSKDESAVWLVLNFVVAVVYVLWVNRAAHRGGIERIYKPRA